MLRIICWKIGSEWAHLKRVFSPQPDKKIFYFAFGANLNREVLELRRIKVYDESDFILENAALRFPQPGFYREHGYASADPASGSMVYGKIYLILERDAKRLDYFECLPFICGHEKVFAEKHGTRFYYYRTTRIVSGLKPTQEYLDYILGAYAVMPIVPENYLKTLELTQVLEKHEPMDKPTLFIRQFDRWPVTLRPVLVGYERLMLKILELSWHASLVQWMISGTNQRFPR